MNTLVRGFSVTLMSLSRSLMGHGPALLALSLSLSPQALRAAPVPSANPPSPLAPSALGAASSPGAAPPMAATQAGMVTIESDRQLADNVTGIVTATGNVRIVYPDRRVLATSRQAQYFSREGRVVLSGTVQVLQEDGHRLLAEQVIYDVSQERLEARPMSGAQVLSILRLRRDPHGAPATGALLPSPIVQPPR